MYEKRTCVLELEYEVYMSNEKRKRAVFSL